MCGQHDSAVLGRSDNRGIPTPGQYRTFNYLGRAVMASTPNIYLSLLFSTIFVLLSETGKKIIPAGCIMLQNGQVTIIESQRLLCGISSIIIIIKKPNVV